MAASNTYRDEDSETKICSICNVELPIGKFRKYNKEKNFRQAMCNTCTYKRYTKPCVEKKAAIIREYKLQQGCVDCGYNTHAEALQFDHLPGQVKRFNVSNAIGSYSLKEIWKEIAKCEVVCANCHAIRTAIRRQPEMHALSLVDETLEVWVLTDAVNLS